MQTETVVELRKLIADESRPIGEREQGAALLVKLLDSIEIEVSNSDPDVMEAMQPWVIESDLDKWLATELAELTQGRSLHGRSLKDAREYIMGQRRAKARAAAVRDTASEMLIRLAYCDVILANYDPEESFHRNNPTRLSVFKQITAA